MKRIYFILISIVIVVVIGAATVFTLSLLKVETAGKEDVAETVQSPEERKQQAKKLVDEARELMVKSQKDQALLKLKEALTIYTDLHLTEESTQVSDEINSLNSLPATSATGPLKQPDPIANP